MNPDTWFSQLPTDQRCRDIWATLKPKEKQTVKMDGLTFPHKSPHEIIRILMRRMKNASGREYVPTAGDYRNHAETFGAASSSSAGPVGDPVPDHTNIHLRWSQGSILPPRPGGWNLMSDDDRREVFQGYEIGEVAIIKARGGLREAGFGYALNALWGQVAPQLRDGKLCFFEIYQADMKAQYAVRNMNQNLYENYFMQPEDIYKKVIGLQTSLPRDTVFNGTFQRRKPHELTRMMVQETDPTWDESEVARLQSHVHPHVQFQRSWQLWCAEIARKVFGFEHSESQWYAVHIRLSDKTNKEAPGNQMTVDAALLSIHRVCVENNVWSIFLCSDVSAFKENLARRLKEEKRTVTRGARFDFNSFSFLLLLSTIPTSAPFFLFLPFFQLRPR